MSEAKKIKDLNQGEQRVILIDALLKAGYNQNEAAQLLKITRARVNQVNKKLQTGTLDPLVRKAKKSVKLILEGKPVGQMREVKGSEVLQAAKMVLDRSDPVTIKTQNTNISVSYELPDPDRERYKKALGIIDAEYEVVSEVTRPALPEPTEESSEDGSNS